jgi:hypothetical protein
MGSDNGHPCDILNARAGRRGRTLAGRVVSSSTLAASAFAPSGSCVAAQRAGQNSPGGVSTVSERTPSRQETVNTAASATPPYR